MGMDVVTVEYKINFLASCQGESLRATGHVADDGRETACAVLQQTLMAVPKTYWISNFTQQNHIRRQIP
ncbi:hypothetical protein [Rhodoferax sp.]|uniref:hypothetical protein n=2 Tax=Rhodoferax sp. TaxID=50421 RepID=UPI0008BAE7C0|nr:hypothetical protein [Rhodoferax sp.]MDO8319654.1 hypothetical protein [Rhodoferax sp.]MDP2678710.1 hypothetical protein [Rhodoferax sp.]OGB57417.1 MAG: hypothetical protein A2503_03825 [Burkholderiales bacterium RIFOXYD12_FULL_59_19]OGB78180.1 MAG: hypothetical protein A2496_16275 [Burkholderiales bacterium RIFOXYC12_FULL_60_6]